MGLIFATIIAAAVAFILGMVWYGPLFGKTWGKLSKLKKTDMKPAPKIMVLALARQLVTAMVLVVLFTTSTAMQLSFLQVWPTVVILWLGFTAMPGLSDVLWVKKPFKLYTINMGFELVSFLVMTLIITWL